MCDCTCINVIHLRICIRVVCTSVCLSWFSSGSMPDKHSKAQCMRVLCVCARVVCIRCKNVFSTCAYLHAHINIHINMPAHSLGCQVHYYMSSDEISVFHVCVFTCTHTHMYISTCLLTLFGLRSTTTCQVTRFPWYSRSRPGPAESVRNQLRNQLRNQCSRW